MNLLFISTLIIFIILSTIGIIILIGSVYYQYYPIELLPNIITYTSLTIIFGILSKQIRKDLGK